MTNKEKVTLIKVIAVVLYLVALLLAIELFANQLSAQVTTQATVPSNPVSDCVLLLKNEGYLK